MSFVCLFKMHRMNVSGGFPQLCRFYSRFVSRIDFHGWLNSINENTFPKYPRKVIETLNWKLSSCRLRIFQLKFSRVFPTPGHHLHYKLLHNSIFGCKYKKEKSKIVSCVFVAVFEHLLASTMSVDPRIGLELEKLNNSCEKINHLEVNLGWWKNKLFILPRNSFFCRF